MSRVGLITCGQQLRSRAASFRPRHGCSLPHQIRHPCPKPSRVARRWDTGDVGRDCAADRNRPPPSIAIGVGPTASTRRATGPYFPGDQIGA